jgi:hypothetical protein
VNRLILVGWNRNNTTFPYRRIERDSDNHRIKVTKNIWLSGHSSMGTFQEFGTMDFSEGIQ